MNFKTLSEIFFWFVFAIGIGWLINYCFGLMSMRSTQANVSGLLLLILLTLLTISLIIKKIKNHGKH